MASSLHPSELLVISQLSRTLWALAFCLLIKRAVILKGFLFPALKQTCFYYFNKIWLQQRKSIKGLDCKPFKLAVFVFHGKYEHVGIWSRVLESQFMAGGLGRGVAASGCFPEFWSLCASYTAWSLWERSGPPFPLSHTYCKGIGWHLWLPACWQPHRCSSRSVPRWHWPPSAETGFLCSLSPDHWHCLSWEDRRRGV